MPNRQSDATARAIAVDAIARLIANGSTSRDIAYAKAYVPEDVVGERLVGIVQGLGIALLILGDETYDDEVEERRELRMIFREIAATAADRVLAGEAEGRGGRRYKHRRVQAVLEARALSSPHLGCDDQRSG